MERSKISIFESFALISIVMPYYAPTHKAFLMLSSLYYGSRNKLDEYFDEFINIMRKYSIIIIINRTEGLIRFSLPSTLFQFKIELNYIGDIDVFITLIKRISKKQGRYFNNHYMHKRIFVVNDSIEIESGFVKELQSYIKDMNNIMVTSTLSHNLYLCKDNPTLFDTLI